MNFFPDLIQLSLTRLPFTSPHPSKASKVSVTTLPNGVTVVTEDSASTTTVALTFPKAGSNNEATNETGAALANKCLTFKSGSGLSTVLIMRNLEDDGAIPFARAGRTSATVGYTCAPDKAVRLIPLLVTTCSFEKWDVRDAITEAATEADAASKIAQVSIACITHTHGGKTHHDTTSKPNFPPSQLTCTISCLLQVVLTEQIFAAAFGAQTAMGKPYYTAGASSPAVQSFRAKAYGIKGAVLAATGVQDHSTFCSHVLESFSEAQVGDDSKVAAPVYMGGEARVHAPSVGATHVALAFAAPSSSVLSNILKECLALQGGTAFGVDGLVGVYGSDVDTLSSSLTTKPTVDIIKRAKNMAKSKAMFALEDGSPGLAAAMTAQVLETGSFLPPSYDAVLERDVSAAYDAMIKSGLTMAAVGNLSMVPYHGTIASRFS